MHVLGLMGQRGTLCHDGSAALFKDGTIVAAVEEERISRNKHAPGEAPSGAAKYCLRHAGITFDDVDHVTYGWREFSHKEAVTAEPGDFVSKSASVTKDVLPTSKFDYGRPPEIYHVDHHVTHLMASVVKSGFDDAACLVADGRGEAYSTSLAEYTDGTIEIIDRFPIEHSLGFLYEAASKFAGLGRHGGGKLMGLSSYGSVLETGWFSFDPDSGMFDSPVDSEGSFESADEWYHDIVKQWQDFFEQTFFPFRPGTSEAPSYLQNFAATVQHELESVVLSLVEYLNRNTSSENLAIGGGVGLNCAANRKVILSDHFEDVFLYPAANDAGCSVGSIYEFCRAADVNVENGQCDGQMDPYIGPAYTDSVIGQSLNWEEYPELEYVRLLEDELLDRVATDLQEEKIVGLFQGRLEFGPRALGHRSILGNPTTRETLYELNELKGRAPWRPLAPSVLATRFENVFEQSPSRELSKYMTTTAQIDEDWQPKVPAVTHVDGTCRPQLVTKHLNERYHKLIERFHARTDVPMVVNTSFNLSGDPIVNTPQEAVETFDKTSRMDRLVLENYYVTRNNTIPRT